MTTSSAPSRRRAPATSAMTATTAGAALAVGWAATEWATRGTAAAGTATHVLLVVALVAVTTACWLRARTHRGEERLLWGAVPVALWGWYGARSVTGGGGWFSDVAAHGGAHAAVWLFSGTTVVAGSVAVVPLARARGTRADLLRDCLDDVLFIATCTAVLWYAVLAHLPRTGDVGPLATLQALVLLAEVSVLVVLVGTVARTRGRYPGVGVLGLATSVFMAGELASGLLGALGQRHPGDLADWGWMTGLSLVVVATGRTTARRLPAGGGRSLVGRSVVPFAAVLLAVGVSVPRLVETSRGGTAVEGWLQVSVLVALVARTLLVMKDADALTRGLERRVDERTVELRESREWYSALAAHSSDLVLVIDADGVLRYASPSAEDLLGRSADALVGTPVAELVAEDDAVAGREVVSALLRGATAPRQVRTTIRHASGRRVVLEMTFTDLLAHPVVRGVVVNAHDTTDAVRLEDELSRQAFSDALTGLPNRALFRDRLEQALRSRGGRTHVKVLYLDLDGFKAVNDTLGHGAGDELLVVVAERLRTTVRHGDTVARLGGDEFAVLLDEEASPEEARRLAQRICDAVRRPCVVREVEVHVATSVGIASTRTTGRDAEQLMRSADLAMYQAKAAREGGYAIYHPDMHEALLERVQLEADLRRAVAESQFRVVYQPLVDMGDGGVSGVEALVRWHHPERGVIAPDRFIPLAESTGLIDAIGAYVLREACQQVSTWRRDVPGAEALRLSVNLSGRQVGDPGLVQAVEDVLADTGLPATSLVLEVTESVLVDQDETTLATLNALRALGIRLAIDDFGTGYSSLSYLHRLPVDILKIDKSFVDRLSTDGDLSLVDAILGMASTLNLTTVAEGIEHDHQRAALAAQGCATGQGFHFSPPVEPHLVPELLVAALRAAEPPRRAPQAPQAPQGHGAAH